MRHIDVLCASVVKVKRRYPFVVHAWVVLPDHFHCVIELPEGDADFATRLRLIKVRFSKALPKVEFRSDVRNTHGERGIWQCRFWEHLIKSDVDFQAHMDYVHIKPR